MTGPEKLCPLCDGPAIDAAFSESRNSWTIRCPNCTVFEITMDAVVELAAADSRRLAGRNRLRERAAEMFSRGECLLIRVDEISTL
jgi:hypothetical protein